MIKVFTSPNAAIVRLAQGVLEQNGVEGTVRNERLASAVGELPWTEVWPELWVEDPQAADRARALMVDFEGEATSAAARPEWVCASCGETCEGQFSECWQCGASRPS